MNTELEFRGFDRESETMVYSSERGLGWLFELVDDDRIALNDVQPLVCLDKNGDKVYVGDDFNFVSRHHPPIKLHFVWDVAKLRYRYENERGDRWNPGPPDRIELIKEDKE